MAAITPAVLKVLWTGAKKNFQEGYDAMDAASLYRDMCTIVNSNDEKETYDWLGEMPELRDWVGARVINDIRSSGYEITNVRMESTIGVKKTDIMNDRLGTYAPRFRMMGEQAARKPDRMLRDLIVNGHSSLCYDGQNFFDTDHPIYPNHDGTGVAATVSNLTAGAASPWYLFDMSRALKPFIFQERDTINVLAKEDPNTSDHVFMNDEFLIGADAYWAAGYGFWQLAHKSQVALDNDSFDAAYEAMMGITADGGRELGIMPTHLVVGRSNRSAANRVVKVMMEAGGGSNPNYEAVEVVVHPLLP